MDATTTTPDTFADFSPDDTSPDDAMQSGLAFWAVSDIELDLFTELAAIRLRTQARAP